MPARPSATSPCACRDAGNGISGNGEPEQSHPSSVPLRDYGATRAQSRGAGGDVFKIPVAADVRRLKLQSRETPERRQSPDSMRENRRLHRNAEFDPALPQAFRFRRHNNIAPAKAASASVPGSGTALRITSSSTSSVVVPGANVQPAVGGVCGSSRTKWP